MEGEGRGVGAFLGYCSQGWALVWRRSHLRFFELGCLLEEIRYLQYELEVNEIFQLYLVQMLD